MTARLAAWCQSRPCGDVSFGEVDMWQDQTMDLHPKQSKSRGAVRWARWGAVLFALLLTALAVVFTSGEPRATAQSVSERQRLVQWERRRTKAAEKLARASEKQADAAERTSRAAEKQARALETMTRHLGDIERACRQR